VVYWQRVRGIRREAWVILVGEAALGFTWSGLSNTLFNLYLVRMGFGPEFVGASAAVATLGYALASIPIAFATRRLGYRRGMIAGILAWIGGIAAGSVADLLPGGGRAVWILATQLVASIGVAMYWVSSSPYLAEATHAAERPHAFALMMSAHPLGAFLGSLVGGSLPGLFAGGGDGTLSAPRPYGASLAVGMLVYLPVLWALLRLDGGHPETQADAEARGAGRMPYAALGVIALVCFLRVGGENAARTFFNVYMDGVWALAPAQIGTAIAVASLLTIPAPLLTPPLVARWGRLPTVVAGALGVSAGIALLALGAGPVAAAGAYVGMSILAAMARSVWTLVVQESVRPEWRSVASGVANLSSGLGVSAMSMAGGYMAATAGYRSAFLAGSALVALGAATLWIWARAAPVRPEIDGAVG
jgi:MFS family permease